MTITKTNIFLLALLTCAMFISGFYEHDLWFSDEPRETGITMRMLDEGNYAIPKLGNQSFLEKPPLYYWFGSALLKLNSDIFPIADVMRLSSLLWGIATLAVIYGLGLVWGRNWPNTEIQKNSFTLAFLSALLLAATNGFVTNALTIRTDIALTFFVALTALGFSLAYLEKKIFGSLLAAFALTGGFLSKGLVAIALSGLSWLVLLPFFIKLWSERKTFLLWHLLIPFIIFISGVGLWLYLLISQGGEDAWQRWFVENSWTRFTGGGQLGHEKPGNFIYYIEPFLVYTLPWGVLWLATILIYYRNWTSLLQQRCLQLWVFLPIIFLSIATTKRPVYLLPVLPFFALAAVFLWAQFQSKWLLITYKILSLVFLLFIIATIIVVNFPIEIFLMHFAEIYTKTLSIPTWSSTLLIITLLFYFIYFNKKPFLQLCSMLLFFVLCANLMVFSAKNPEESRHELQHQIAAKGGVEEWVATYDSYMTEGLQGYLYTYYRYIPK